MFLGTNSLSVHVQAHFMGTKLLHPMAQLWGGSKWPLAPLCSSMHLFGNVVQNLTLNLILAYSWHLEKKTKLPVSECRALRGCRLSDKPAVGFLFQLCRPLLLQHRRFQKRAGDAPGQPGAAACGGVPASLVSWPQCVLLSPGEPMLAPRSCSKAPGDSVGRSRRRGGQKGYSGGVVCGQRWVCCGIGRRRRGGGGGAKVAMVN